MEEASRVSPAFRAKLEHLVDEVECSVCGGSRLRDDAAAVRLRGRTIDDLCRLPLGRLLDDWQNWKLSEREQKIAGEVNREIRNRVQFLVDVGLDYLTLARPAPSLSGGEMQRIRLAAQVGSGLCGVLYVLDEPTIGLHPRDNRRLLDALRKAPRPGQYARGGRARPRGGPRAPTNCSISARPPDAMAEQIVAQGTPAQVAKRRGSVTGPYLSGKKAIPVPTTGGCRGTGDGRRMALPRANAAPRPTPHAPRPSSLVPRSRFLPAEVAGDPRRTAEQPQEHHGSHPAGHA